MVNRIILLFLVMILLISFTMLAVDAQKPRVMILTDIENEPDDAQSLVRFLLYSNQFEVEGIVATTSCWQRDKIADWRIYEILDSYEKVHANLLEHESGYPEAGDLRKLVKRGIPEYGMDAVGKDKRSEGSDHIVSVLKDKDDRPLWVLVWGGANTLAQALYQIKMQEPPSELERLTNKLRVYTISDQDDSGPWIRNNFPNIFYIVSPGYHENGGNSYFYATWTGISGERHYKFPSGADKDLILNPWVDENIQNGHGPLGKEYPDIAYAMEGDTPSFLYLINNGLGSFENPDWGSWGGRYELYTPHYQKFFHEPESRPIWTNAKDMVWVDDHCYVNEQATIWRWREAYQSDFAARMDWCLGSYDECNHPPRVQLSHGNVITVQSGKEIRLDASQSTDPDGDELSFNWFHYPEPANYVGKIEISNSESSGVSLMGPNVKKPSEIHIILELTDKGEPALTRYQRVILNVIPAE
jgi:hypothetical protein